MIKKLGFSLLALLLVGCGRLPEEPMDSSMALPKPLEYEVIEKHRYVLEANDASDFIKVDGDTSVELVTLLEQGGLQEVCFEISNSETSESLCQEFDVVLKADTLGYDYRLSLTEILDSFFNEYGISTNVSYFYHNLSSGENYLYNPEQVYLAASTIKVPLSMLYFDLINNGELSLNSYVGGYLLEDLIYDAIAYSGNDSTEVLLVGYGEFTRYREALKKYADITYWDSFNYTNEINALYAYEMLKYLVDNRDDYQLILDFMYESTQEGYLRSYVDVDMAHKYGSYMGNEHDIAILNTEEPLILGVYTYGFNEYGSMFIGYLGRIMYEYYLYH